MVSIVGSSSVTTRSATNRDASFAGMRREPTSTIANAPKTGRETKTSPYGKRSYALRCSRKSSAPPKHCARYSRRSREEPPLEAQVALLRVLQEREFERVGGSQTVSVDVRVLAATNRDLGAAVAEGSFRQDLFYRLNVFPIHIPALRERVDDIPLLVEYLIDRYAQAAGKKIRNINKGTLDLFQNYDWPGNVRELQNVIERAVILSDGETFIVDETWLTPVTPKTATTTAAPLVANLMDHEKEMIENALREAD